MWEKSEEQEQQLKLLRLLFEEEEDDAGFAAVEKITPRDSSAELLLSFAQQRLWLLDQLQPGNSSYNIATALRLTGPVNVSIVELSLAEIVRRHEALRTRFALADGRPLQVIDEDVPSPLTLHDLCGVAADEREAAMLVMAAEEARTPFDLAAGPLFRAALLKLAPDSHVLLLTMHHIISDAWSLGVFVKELVTLYQAYEGGQTAPLPPLAIQYADFALWQRQWLQGEVLERQLAYWKQQLGDKPPVLGLHTDHPRPAVQTYRGALQTVTYPARLIRAIKTLSLQSGATLFTTLLAAFNALLSRYTGQEDILVGTPIANRNRAEIEPLIGFFVNTLVMRTDLSGDPPFRELLARVHEVTLGAYDHQDVPFEKLVQELQPERDTSRQPLFQVMFALQNAGLPAVKLSGLKINLIPIAAETSKFDFTLIATELEEGLRVEMEYNTDLFEAATIERMLAHYENLLDGIAHDADRPLSHYELLTGPERRQLLHDWQPPERADGVNGCLHELFERQAAQTPDAVAIVCEADQKITYGELNARANRLAHHLRELGVGPEVLVGLYVERSPEMIAGLLAILKAGGAYVPIDTQYPPERQAYMLRDAGASVVLTTTALAAELRAGSAEVICLDSAAALIGRQSSQNPARAGDPGNTAYVIYTSGSTGRPKGVQVTHANVLRLFAATEDWFRFDARDVWTLFHSYAFDFSVWEIWGGLLYGGRLVVVPYLVSRTPQAFVELLRREQVTVLNQTPSAFRQLIQADATGSDGEQLNLRLVIFGGEALELESLEPWFARYGDERPRLVNMYGITETTVHTTYRPLTRADVTAGRGSVIGRPLPDLRLYLLDEHLRPVPVGVPGEIFVGGAGLARGYLNQPELTAQRFIPSPHGTTPGARLYRSGDLGRYRADGDIQYLGRADQQVKIRGFRIELGEVEAALHEHEAVLAAVVVARADEAADRRLVAYVVFDGQARPDAGALRAFLKERLPDYMIPASFVELAALPLTTNGKIDRRALPAPDLARPESQRTYVAPQTRAEQALAEVWAGVLGVERVGVHDNFFELGGDSIRSIQVIARAREAGFGYSLQQLFQYQTIYELCRKAIGDQAEAAAHEASQPFALLAAQDRRLAPPDVEDAYPLTMLQAGMLFHSEYDAASTTYYNVTSFHLRARFDLRAFETALRRLLERHQVLRTSFDLANYSEPLQLIHRVVPVPLEVDDLSALRGAEQDAYLARWFAAEIARPFYLARAPLLRFHLHRRDAETFQLTLSEHHAILDGWSVALMLTELFRNYLACLDGAEPTAEPAAPGLFRDFVALERAALREAGPREYWTKKLQDSLPSRLPRRVPAHVEADDGRARIQSVDVPISEVTSEGLKRLARAEGLPLKSVLLAAHLRVVGLLSGQRDVVTGLLAHGRSEEAAGELVLGLFLNTLPLRVQLGTGSWLDLVRATFAAEHELLPFRYYPMAQIQIDRGGQPLFETAFNFTNFHVYQALADVAEVEVLATTDFAETNFPFWANFSLDRTSGQVVLALKCDRLRLSDEQMSAATGYYARALQLLAAEPSAPYDAHSLLSAAERQRLLRESDRAQEKLPLARLEELFEAQVDRTPDRCAVVFEDRRLTYRELDTQANLLARHLRQLGVGAETTVGILLPRSTEMIVALLGVLKAGGAYVPLDPGYPQERLDFMLSDAGAAVLLTQTQSRSRVQAHGLRVVCLDTDWAEVTAAAAEAESVARISSPAREASVDNLAYVIYTSGSTGLPKGVAVERRSAAMLIEWARASFQPEDLAGVLASTPLTFDLSIFELFVPLSTGGTVILADNVLCLPALPAADRVTLVNTVPSVLTELLSGNALPASVRTVNLAGEPLPHALVRQIYDESNARQVFNLYGPTEDTTYSTCARIERGDDEAPAIGRPITNTQAYVLDERMQLVPAGVAGELYLAGAGLARGYLRRPDLTAVRFLPDPFGASAGARMYRTGDLARYRADGQLEYLGRIDHQVKVRGFRIELGEIEAALASHADVREALVLAREDVPGEKRLVAYLVTGPESRPDVSRLRAHLKRRLPDYMLPSAFVLLDALPLTAHGKVDRRALPAPAAARPTTTAYVAARTPAEEEMVRIWAEALGVERVGIYDSFFELGGHSLLALRLMAQVQRKFGTALPVSTLFRAENVATLSRDLTLRPETRRETSLVRIQPQGPRPPFVCIHPVGGSVFCYRELARHLGTEQPLYALQAPGLNGEPMPAAVPEMAAHYIAEMLRAQPQGPFYLGGWSFGGVVAFEMAQQLRAQGHEVALLALLDSYSPLHESQTQSDVNDESQVLSRLIVDVASMSAQALSISFAQLQDSYEEFCRLELDAEDRLRYAWEQGRKLGVLSPDIDLKYFRRLYEVFKSNVRAARAYEPQAYAGRTVLLAAQDADEFRFGDASLGWRRFVVGSFDIQLVPGNHYTILAVPQVQALAAALRAQLAGAAGPF